MHRVADAWDDDLDDDDIDDLLDDYGYDQDYSKRIVDGENGLSDAIEDTVNNNDDDDDDTVNGDGDDLDDFEDDLSNHDLVRDYVRDFDPNEARNAHGEWGSGGSIGVSSTGSHLTGAAIIAEAPVIKPRSRSVMDVAKDLNKRAGLS